MEQINGYEILKSTVFANSRGFALGHNSKAPSPYVTWQFTEGKNGQRDYYWGHYGNSREWAEKDFTRRVEDYKDLQQMTIRSISEQPKECYLLHVMVTAEELEQIHARMAEAGISNTGAYVRKMALNGYILHVDLAPVKELVSLQRRCSNNLNQVAVHAHTYGVYPEEIAGLQKDYEKLWGEVSKVLRELTKLVAK